jgi:hypothetical protein
MLYDFGSDDILLLITEILTESIPQIKGLMTGTVGEPVTQVKKLIHRSMICHSMIFFSFFAYLGLVDGI